MRRREMVLGCHVFVMDFPTCYEEEVLVLGKIEGLLRLPPTIDTFTWIYIV